jgi:DNA-binding beta-propeller fold protein YncE
MKQLFCGLLASVLLFGAAGQARSDFVYWTDYGNGDIRRANLDGTGQTILVTGQNQPVGIALDTLGGKMYWCDISGGDVRRANLDGTDVTVLVSGLNHPRKIALDLAGGMMYWSDDPLDGRSGDIRRANLDGTGQTILIQGLPGPRGMYLDVAGGKMYWDDAVLGQILRANLDGSGQEILIEGLPTSSLHLNTGIALDLTNRKMYLSEGDGVAILRANLDGSGLETILAGLSSPVGIAVDIPGGKMYWADILGGKIMRANLDGTEVMTLFRGLTYPTNIALALSAAAPGPVLVTGYSADVISDKDPSVRFAQPMGASTFAWFESGAVDDSGTQHNDGLPAGLTFASATGSGATYQIQPPNANNVLQLSAVQTGTLTLTAATAYSTLAIIASSGDGTPSSVGSGTINFADGSTQAFSYNCFDWCNGQGGLHPEAVFPGPNGRADVGPAGTAFTYNQDCDFQVYETVIAIDPSHEGVAIASIDFTGAPDAYFSNIFGVSGR